MKPTIRFLKYKSDWDLLPLDSFVERIKTKNTNNESSLVLTISAQYGLISQTEFFNKSVASKNLSNYYLLRKGDFAYNKSYSAGYPLGAIKRLELYEKGVVSNLYFCFKPLELVDSDFLSHYFESDKWHEAIASISGEGARNHGLLNMSVGDFFKTKHYLPSLDEQRDIALLLNEVSERISLQKELLAELNGLFKTMSKELFEKGFESRSLSDVCKISKGKQVNSETLLEYGDYYVMNGGIVPSGYLNEYNVEADTISISEGGASCGYVQFNKSRFWAGGHCYFLTNINADLNNKFLFYYLKYKEEDLMDLRVGSGLPNIQKKDLNEFQVLIPPMKQQIRIVDFLDYINDLIEKENTRLKEYQEEYSVLLKNIFC